MRGNPAKTVGDRSGLVVTGLTAGYTGIDVLHDVDLRVPPGSVVALLGANGAGKTTTLRTLAGLLPASSGCIAVDGRNITGWAPERRVGVGLCLIPEGRGIFRSLTVAENLDLMTPPGRKPDLERVIDSFPALGRRLKQVAGTMSGGEQQMVALSRAFVAKPGIVMLDEVSMGLAPLVVDQLFDALKVLTGEGTSLLLVEQYLHRAMAMAAQVCVLARGRIAYSGSPVGLSADDLAQLYLGSGGKEAPSGDPQFAVRTASALPS